MRETFNHRLTGQLKCDIAKGQRQGEGAARSRSIGVFNCLSGGSVGR